MRFRKYNWMCENADHTIRSLLDGCNDLPSVPYIGGDGLEYTFDQLVRMIMVPIEKQIEHGWIRHYEGYTRAFQDGNAMTWAGSGMSEATSIGTGSVAIITDGWQGFDEDEDQS